MIVGVLAFQGDFLEHRQILTEIGVRSIAVRSLEDLASVSALIIPGGESTVMATFLSETGVGPELRRRSSTFPVFGTCAGAILQATNVVGKHAPEPLRLIDITVDRNAYGAQIDSFEAAIRVRGITSPVRASFIRAPKITRVGEGVDVLATHGGVPVLVRQGWNLAATFHPEVRGGTAVHRLFLALCTPVRSSRS